MLQELVLSQLARMQRSGIVETREFPAVNLTQLRLGNGMTVWLKPTDYENDEIVIKLAALGGYASLPAADRPSGELAASIAWESGMGKLSGDQLSVLLYENSLDFAPKIQAFSRTIDGTSGNNGLGVFFHCVQMLFTQQKMSAAGMDIALANAKDSFGKMASDYEHIFETLFLKINTQGMPALQPLASADLAKVKLAVTKEFFHRAFSDPAEFVCVVVGSFDLPRMKALIKRYLGAIPKLKPAEGFVKNFGQVFPKGVTQQQINLPKRTDALTSLTFPWRKPMDEEGMYKMSFSCQVIEAHLRRVIIERMKLSYGIDVLYEFPFYPYLDCPWISIRFRCDADRVQPLRELIMAELKHLQEKGITQDDVEAIQHLEAGSNEFWLHDNFYWMSMLTNYYLWKWDPQWIYRGAAMMQDLAPATINALLKTAISLDNYSAITANP